MPDLKKKFTLTIFAFFIFAAFTLVWAADFPFLDKSKIRLVIPAGGSKYGEVVIENPTMQEKTMRVYLEDWRYLPSADGAKEFAPAGSYPSSCTSWITFSPSDVTVPAFGQKRVSYSVKAPAAVQGTYYAVLFFESQFAAPTPEAEGIGAGINLALRTAVLFYIEVEGTNKKAAEFSNLNAAKDPASGKLLINLDFQNSGNVDITTKGLFDIMDNQGMVYARGEFNDTYTFAGSTAGLSASWGEIIPKGKYSLILTFDLGRASREAGMAGGPVIAKEAEIEIGDNGEVVGVGELK